MRRRYALSCSTLFLLAGCTDGSPGNPGLTATASATATDGMPTATDGPDSESDSSGGGSGSGGTLPTGGSPDCTEGDACPPGSACDGPGACASNVCVDGVCCDTACDGACESCETGTCTPISPEQQPECGAGISQWVQGWGNPVDVEDAPNSNFDRGTSVAIDDAGNVYLVGTFNQQIDFGGGVLEAAGGDDAFVASFTPDGMFRWANRIGNTGHDTGGGVALIPGSSDLVVAGATTGDPGLPGQWTSDAFRGFVAVLARDTGNVVRARAVDASVRSRASSVTAGASAIYVAGGFEGTLETGTPRVSLGDEDQFVVRFDLALTPNWNWAGGDENKDLARAVAVSDNGSVALTGFNSSPGAEGGNTQNITVTAFAAPLGAAPSWNSTYASPPAGRAKGHSLTWTAQGGVVTTGFFTGPVDFGNGPVASGGTDGVLLQLDGTNGTTQNVTTYGANGDDNSRGVTVDDAGNIFVTGEFNDTVTLGPDTLTSAGGDDVFVARFGPDGVAVWARRYGGSSNDNGNGIALGSNGRLIATGHFREMSTFDGTELTSAEGADAFLMQLLP